MYEELIKRLRSESALPYGAIKDMREAADAIENLRSFIGAEDAERMEAYPPKEET